MSTPRAIAYLATSVDGFIAGPNDDLGWLTDPRFSGMPFAADAWAARAEGGLGFDALLASVGCLLMGRRTYDAVRAMDVPWPYGDLIVTIIPTVLGSGISLWDATVPHTDLTIVDVNKYADGFVQVHYRCR